MASGALDWKHWVIEVEHGFSSILLGSWAWGG
jgi:hypothetical protein